MLFGGTFLGKGKGQEVQEKEWAKIQTRAKVQVKLCPVWACRPEVSEPGFPRTFPEVFFTWFGDSCPHHFWVVSGTAPGMPQVTQVHLPKVTQGFQFSSGP